MPWYVYSLIGLVLSAFYAICIKWALNLKISRERLLLFTFTGYTIGYFLLDIKDINHILSSGKVWLWLFWGAVAGAFSIFGNLQSVKATQNAPNVGYAESVKSANAIVTTFFAWLIFGAVIPAQKWIGIAIIPLGLFFLLAAKKENKHTDWRFPAILGALLFSGMFVIYKQMGSLSFSPLEIILVLCFFVTIGFIVINLFKKDLPWKYPLTTWLPIGLAIIIGIFANWTNLIAVGKFSNPGVPQAIMNTQAALTLGISRFVFASDKGGEWDLKKWLGVIITIIGVIIIALAK